MEKQLLTERQKFRKDRNDAILKSYNETFKAGDSKTEWAKKEARKRRIGYLTVYNVIKAG